MKITLSNSSILKDFLETIERTSGLRVCLSDLKELTEKDNRLLVNESAFVHTSPYCSVVKTSKAAHKLCAATHNIELKTPVCITCYAGLKEIMIPVYAKHNYLGLIKAGQVLFKELSSKKTAKIMKKLESLGVNKNEALLALKKVPIVPEKTVRLALDLLNMLANFISEAGEKQNWQEEIKRIQGSYKALNKKDADNGLEYLIKSVRNIRNIKNRGIIDKAIAEINKMPLEKVKLAKIAKDAGLSRFYFSRLFKASAGRSFRDHVMLLRIEKAKVVMNDLNLSLSEVAYKCGYENLSSFTRTFKKLTGINPGKYRILNLKIS